MKSLILVTILSLAIFSAQAANWAVLVAGSNGFWNYRHQADVCHAYQIVKANGIPEENIIVMAYDDIAYSPSNPFPGQIFNQPSKGPGINVYADCKIDYSGDDVNPTNFLYILKGNSTALPGRKVLKSTKDDKVFINFVDHGATGLIAFPNEYLYADDLVDALKHMHTYKSFDQLVFYLEACESGSMFQTLPSNINIFATTAANSDESSWASYCPGQDFVNGTEIGTCLGDLYSTNWMENSDSGLLNIESLLQQFLIVQLETKLSNVCKFGDFDFEDEIIGNFQGEAGKSFLDIPVISHDYSSPENIVSIDSREVKLAYLQSRASKLLTAASQSELQTELNSQYFIDEFFNLLALQTYGLQYKSGADSIAMAPVESINFPCLKQAVSTYTEECGSLGEYGLKYVRIFANLCNTVFGEQIPAMIPNICEQTELKFTQQ